VYAQAQRPEEPFRLVAECLVVADETTSVDVRLRFLQLVPQEQSVPPLTDPSLAWDEAVERTSEHSNLHIREMLTSPLSLTVPAGPELKIDLTISAQELEKGACKLRFEVQNASSLPSGADARREEALPASFVSAHLLLGISSGEFISLLDPPEAYQASVRACSNQGVFPVLVGEEPERRMMFCSPIILYDYPKIAPESAGDFFDGTEMDEMLTLRVLTLTDAEKREMQNGDPRARRILERTEALTDDAMLKAHGVIRELRGSR
jgi:hypothetical protein